MKHTISLVLGLFLLVLISCHKNNGNYEGPCPPNDLVSWDMVLDSKYEHCDYVLGCIDPNSESYDPNANVSSGLCVYDKSVVFWKQTGGNFGTIYLTYLGSSPNNINDSSLIDSVSMGYNASPICESVGCVTLYGKGYGVFKTGNNKLSPAPIPPIYYEFHDALGNEWVGRYNFQYQCDTILLN